MATSARRLEEAWKRMREMDPTLRNEPVQEPEPERSWFALPSLSIQVRGGNDPIIACEIARGEWD